MGVAIQQPSTVRPTQIIAKLPGSRISSAANSSTGSVTNRKSIRTNQFGPGMTNFTTRAPKTMTLINNRTTESKKPPGYPQKAPH